MRLHLHLATRMAQPQGQLSTKVAKPSRKEEARREKYRTKAAARRLIHHWRIDRRTGFFVDDSEASKSTAPATAPKPPSPPPAIEPAIRVSPPQVALKSNDLLAILNRNAPLLVPSPSPSSSPPRVLLSPMTTAQTSSAVSKASIHNLIN